MFLRDRSLSGIVLCALILTSPAGVMARHGGRPDGAIREAFQSLLKGR